MDNNTQELTDKSPSSEAPETQTGLVSLALCKWCLLPIPKTASVCTKCNLFQDWRGKLHFTERGFSLAIAFFSVITAASAVGALLWEKLMPLNSSINVVAINSGSAFVPHFYPMETNQLQAFRLELLVMNNGNAPGLIRGVIVNPTNVWFVEPKTDKRLSQNASLDAHDTLLYVGDTRPAHDTIRRNIPGSIVIEPHSRQLVGAYYFVTNAEGIRGAFEYRVLIQNYNGPPEAKTNGWDTSHATGGPQLRSSGFHFPY